MTTAINMTNSSKQKLALRYWLQGRGFHQALRAMEYAAGWHVGVRKDGSPEFSHQVWQANFVRTLDGILLNTEAQVCVAFLHDVVEDYPVSVRDVRTLFGDEVGSAIEKISKVIGGHKKTDEEYFSRLSECPLAALGKGVDRMHNHQTMIGAFSIHKQMSYIQETEEWILPMLKKARRSFPEQEAAFENVKHNLLIQIELLKFAHQGLNDKTT
jgi:(p)ppGpp synthase/HD superfamily hydrolase